MRGAGAERVPSVDNHPTLSSLQELPFVLYPEEGCALEEGTLYFSLGPFGFIRYKICRSGRVFEGFVDSCRFSNVSSDLSFFEKNRSALLSITMARGHTLRKHQRWQWLVAWLAFFSEASNIGIVIKMASVWFHFLLALGSGVLSYLAFITDPLIYCFKALIRLTRLVGRLCFSATFDDVPQNKLHPYQTLADVVSLTLFVFTVLLFFGVLISGPVGITVAWCLGLSGLGIIGYFDYFHQERLARKAYEEIPDDLVFEKEVARRKYVNEKIAKWLFVGLLLGLAVLLICGSAAVFAPPALVPILMILSKVASGYLAFIAAARVLNWMYSGKKVVNPVNVETVDKPLPSREAIRQAYRQQPTAGVVSKCLLAGFFAPKDPERIMKIMRRRVEGKDPSRIESSASYHALVQLERLGSAA